MGYNEYHLNIIRLLDNILDWHEQSVIELGSQDLELGIIRIENFVKSLGKLPLNFHDYFDKNKARISAKFLFHSLGVSDYSCIDIDGVHNALKFDLNFNLKEKYNFNKKFSIVTNFGTTEHIVNQLTCFENIHNLCKSNGIIIISLPIQGFTNHGFFNYQPTFFYHLAEKNNYEILYQDSKSTSYITRKDSKNFTIILRKKREKRFQIPIQTEGINYISQKISFLESEAIKKQFFKVAGIDLKKIKNVAIFGAGAAGREAFEVMNKINKKVICFIDDFKSGFFQDTSIPIVTFDKFILKYQENTDIIVAGKNQKGNIINREGLTVGFLKLSKLIQNI